MLVFAVDLPVSGQVTRASQRDPFLGFKLDLVPARVAELAARVYPNGVPKPSDNRGLYVGHATDGIIDAVTRLLDLMGRPEDADLLGPLVVDEILIRLLRTPIGTRVAQIGEPKSGVHRVATAVSWIRAHFAQPVTVEEMAAAAHMSASSFHQRFKAVTTMSPLQYQKALRLHEARRLMLFQKMDANDACHRVGYLSPSQFSRELRAFLRKRADEGYRQTARGGVCAERCLRLVARRSGNTSRVRGGRIELEQLDPPDPPLDVDRLRPDRHRQLRRSGRGTWKAAACVGDLLTAAAAVRAHVDGSVHVRAAVCHQVSRQPSLTARRARNFGPVQGERSDGMMANMASSNPHPADSHEIRVQGARVNNLKDVSVEIPKRRLTVFTGVSGSGKSSLVFGTVAAESQRLINETYSAFVQGFMPAMARPEVDVLEGLTTAIIVDQERMGANSRSTVGTATDANAMLRVLFSRLAKPHIGP